MQKNTIDIHGKVNYKTVIRSNEIIKMIFLQVI